MSLNDSTSGSCRHTGCGCERYQPQFYRPALCKFCFHDISTHFAGQYDRIENEDKVYYVHLSTGHRLFAQPAYASESVASHQVIHSDLNTEKPKVADDESPQLDASKGPPTSNRVHPPSKIYADSAAGTGISSMLHSSAESSKSDLLASLPLATDSKEAYMETAELTIAEEPARVPDTTIQSLGLDVRALEKLVQLDPAHDPLPTAKEENETKAPAPAPPGIVTVVNKGEGARNGAPALDGRTADADYLEPSAFSFLLQPVLGDPLLVNVQQLLSAAPKKSGIIVFEANQTLEETYKTARYLVVTPFTLMAVTAHPSKLGWGILQWERSIISLQRISVQQLDTHTSATNKKKLLSTLFKKRSATDSVVTQAHDALALLFCFAPETKDTMTFLRMYRSGKRPVRLEGFLQKRKRAAWREAAPLGPLSWKRRFFLLQSSKLSYYTAPPQSGGVLKGEIPLTGWVEVSKVGSELGPVSSAVSGDITTRPHCFTVRTGQTYHVFQASNAEECDAWVAALNINAQHWGAASDVPQCVVMNKPEAAQALMTAISKAHADLVASMRTPVSPLECDSLRPHEGDHGTLSLADAIAMVHACGEVTEELLEQLNSEDAEELRKMFLLPPASPDLTYAVKSTPANLATIDASGNLLVTHAHDALASETWTYLDDQNNRQGPFPETVLRAWLLAGQLRPDILLKYEGFIKELDETTGVDESGVPTLYVPLTELFPDPAALEVAFTEKGTGWVGCYRQAFAYQSLLESAASLGIDPVEASSRVLHMRELDLPPDLSILMDVMGLSGSLLQNSTA